MSKELQQIIQKIESLGAGEKAVLATVVDVQGSSYRLPGAKMLITETGETFGMVSGGCLEADVLERAKKVLETGEPQVFTYDTTAAKEDSIFSLNMGCRGIVRILLEPVSDDYFDFLKNNFKERQNMVTATVIGTNDSEKFPMGKRFFFDSEKNSQSALAGEILSDINQIFETKRSTSKVYENDSIEFFYEFIKPPFDLLIFGAGADAVPLAEIAKNLGWRVSVVDHRSAYASKERFPEADHIFLIRPENLGENLKIDGNAVAVVMTHNYESDKYIHKFLLGTNAAYIGALGPKKRTERLLAEIGAKWPENIYAPVGLDIGAETPEEIALAIIAEIQSVLKNRSAGFLRDRQAGIH